MGKMSEIIAIAVSLTVSIAATFICIYTGMMYKKPLPKNETEMQIFKMEGKKSVTLKNFKLEEMKVNLNSENNRLRYLTVEMFLTPFENDFLDLLEGARPIIQHIIIDTSDQMLPSELNTVSGKILFEARVKKKINDLFPQSVVKEIYFSNFMVQ